MKKIIALLLALVLMSVALVACNKPGNSDDTEAPEVTKAPDDTKKLIVATNSTFPPYIYPEEGKLVGIDAEIAETLAKKLGMELEWKDIAFDEIVTCVKTGGALLGIGGISITEDRKKDIDFTVSYATGVQVIIVKADSAIASPDDLAGKKIGVQLMTTGDIYASDDYGEENVKKYNSGAEAVEALKGGVVDAVIIDNEPAKSFIKVNEGLKILETEYAVEDYAITVSKENKDLLAKVNKALEEMTTDGTIDGIIAKYIKAE